MIAFNGSSKAKMVQWYGLKCAIQCNNAVNTYVFLFAPSYG